MLHFKCGFYSKHVNYKEYSVLLRIIKQLHLLSKAYKSTKCVNVALIRMFQERKRLSMFSTMLHSLTCIPV